MADLYTPEQQEQIRTLCKTNLKYLCIKMLGMDWWDPTLHDPLALYLMRSGRKKLILVPRGHLKSSIVTVGYAIQRILVNPNTRILITNAVWDNARTFLSQISDYLTDKSQLSAFFGDFNGPKANWTKDAITIQQRTKAKKEPTVATAGVEKALASQHYDLILHDDLVNDENVTTKEQQNKVDNFYRASVNLLDPGGEMILIGTRYAVGDLYGRILESEVKTVNGKPLPPEMKGQWRNLVQ